MIVWTLGLIPLSPPAAADECDSRELDYLVNVAEGAFSTSDVDTLLSVVASLEASLVCQAEPLSPIHVAAFHRIEALAAIAEFDAAAAVLSFQAVLATMPGYQLAPELAPEGHPVRKAFDEAKLFADSEVFELPAPEAGWITIDGNRSQRAPAGRPFLFQHLSAEGAVTQTAYVDVGTPVPTYATAPVPVPDPPVPTRTRARVNPWLVGAGIALGAASVSMYGGAFVARDRYDEAVLAGDEGRIRSRYWTTNGLLGGSVAALGVGTTLVLVGSF